MSNLEMYTINDAHLVFRNFEGAEGQYNKKGDRNFAILLAEQDAKTLAEDGWNVKMMKPREDDENPEPRPYIQVSVSYKGRPPRVVVITSAGRTNLTEDTVETLDWAEFSLVDVILRPYNWTVNGASGTKAYLKTLFATVEEDELERRYSPQNEENNS